MTQALKDTKIFIPEIPVAWTKRSRSGHINIWNDQTDDPVNFPEIRLHPPMQGLYAELFEDGWYWVCGCNQCIENNEKWSYIVCYEHDRCITCGTHNEELTEIAWQTPDGIQCKPCDAKEHEKEKQKALRLARENGHDKWDCFREDRILCPRCASEQSDDDIYKPGTHQLECDVCDLEFELELDYEPKYTTSYKKEND